MSVDRYDALVIGGGPAGASTAIALAQAGWRVAIVEKKAFPRRKVCGEFISATSWPLLARLGVADALAADAGPEVRRVGLYAGDVTLTAPMPGVSDAAPRRVPHAWCGRFGRALSRERLDTMLLARAAEAGADVLQPWTTVGIEADEAGYRCSVVPGERAGASARVLRARIVVAAHGSWEPGTLPTQHRHAPRASDLFAFKAHFRAASLPAGLMPLLIFPGGYGGMVETDGDRVSLSCCIRRDALERYRRGFGAAARPARAAAAMLAHIEASCRGVRAVLAGATLDGAWLSAGPIRPGVRPSATMGIVPVGNVAGEAHPIIAEGISMAIQSAWLASGHLIACSDAIFGAASAGRSRRIAALEHAYARDWRRNFALRVRASAALAQLAMRPATAGAIVAFARCMPSVLTLGARVSGKARPLRVADTAAA